MANIDTGKIKTEMAKRIPGVNAEDVFFAHIDGKDYAIGIFKHEEKLDKQIKKDGFTHEAHTISALNAQVIRLKNGKLSDKPSYKITALASTAYEETNGAYKRTHEAKSQVKIVKDDDTGHPFVRTDNQYYNVSDFGAVAKAVKRAVENPDLGDACACIGSSRDVYSYTNEEKMKKYAPLAKKMSNLCSTVEAAMNEPANRERLPENKNFFTAVANKFKRSL